MKIVLTQDVPKLGEMGTIQDVKPGFARNYLIPQGMALIATPGIVKQVEQRQEAERRRIALLEEENRELAERIEGTRLEMEVRVGEQGRLYGSITASDIAEALTEAIEADPAIDRRSVELEAPIREIGEFTVPIRLVGRLVPEITVNVFDPNAPLLSAQAAEGEEDETDELPPELVYEVSDEDQEADELEAAEEEAAAEAAEESEPAEASEETDDA